MPEAVFDLMDMAAAKSEPKVAMTMMKPAIAASAILAIADTVTGLCR